MTKLVAPSEQLKYLDVKNPNGKTSYKAGKDEMFHVNNPRHIQHMKAEGFIESSLMGMAKSGMGFDCECGFGSWFAVCSRCGRDNSVKEEVASDD